MEGYTKTQYPESRLATFDVGKIGGGKHHVAGFLELDVTDARIKIRKLIKSGSGISFNAWFIRVLGKTIEENNYIHAINHHKLAQIAFHQVDISVPLEKTVRGVRVPLPLVIRGANEKSVEEIHNEIQTALAKPVTGEQDFVLSERKNPGLTAFFFHLPQRVRLLVWRRLLRNPFTVKENMGTVMVTNMGAAGRFPGWILPKSIHNTCFGLGSIVRKPWVVKQAVEIREILHLTVLFDHDAVDGVPAARFVSKLVTRLEGAWEL